jgi:hypothetical protein
MKNYKVTYYDEIEADTVEEAYEILLSHLASDVEHKDVSCFEFEEEK